MKLCINFGKRMGDLTKNINRWEIACKCGCSFDTIDHKVVEIVQGACDHFSKILCIPRVYLHISSGCRCPKHNENAGGADKSLHMFGRAIDHKIREVTVKDLYNYYLKKYHDFFGFGLYLDDDFVHADSRDGVWRK